MGASFLSLSAVLPGFLLGPWWTGGGCAESPRAWLSAFCRPCSGAAPVQGSWMGLQSAFLGVVLGAGAGSWSAAAGEAQAVSFTSTG